MSALDYALKREWSMGNGQCPECCGAHEGWFGHPCHRTPDTIGHELNCELAASIKELGGEPLMLGQFKSERKFESCVTPGGFLATCEVTTSSSGEETRTLLNRRRPA